MRADQDNPENEIMCQCSGTRRAEIRELFLSGKDMDAIARWTGALTGCGGCEWEIEYFLEELAKEFGQQTK